MDLPHGSNGGGGSAAAEIMATRRGDFTIRSVEVLPGPPAAPPYQPGAALVLADVLSRAGDPENWVGEAAPKDLRLGLVKRSTVRTILGGEVQVGGSWLPVHIKLFRPMRLSDRARDALGGSKADRELDNLLAARAGGLPTVAPLLAGTWRGSAGSRSFLATATEPGALPIGDGPWPGPIARAIGSLLRAVHDRGLHTHDLHPGNMLVVPGGEPRAVLVDLGNAHMGERLERKERAKGLAFFCQYLDGGILDRDAAPIREGYGEIPPVLAAACRQATLRVRFRMLSAFGRRAFRPCRHTAVEHRPRKPKWLVHQPDPTEAAPAPETALAMVKELGDLIPIKSGRRGGVYIGEDPFAGLVAKGRTASAARQLWQASYWLLRAGVPAPNPVALHTFHGRGVVIHRHVGAGPNLQQELETGSIRPEMLLPLAADLGRTVGRMHGYGLRNRDLKFDNLVRTGDSIIPVDLDGIRRKNLLDPRGQGADLGRLLAAFRHAGSPGGNPVILRFLAAYHRQLRRLLLPGRNAWLLRLAARRADEWALRHGGAIAAPGKSSGK